MMILIQLLLASAGAHAEKTVTVTATATATHGTAEGKAPEVKKPPLDRDAGPDLEKMRDSVNEAWDGTVKGVGKIFRGSATSTATSTGTATSTATR